MTRSRPADAVWHGLAGTAALARGRGWVSAGRAGAGEGDVRRVEDEVVVIAQSRGHGAEQVRRNVEHCSAPSTRCVQVRALGPQEVVGGPAVADVDVLNDPYAGQRLKGAVDAGPVHARILLRDGPDDLLGGDVAGMRGQGVDDSPSGPRHPLAPGTQHARDLGLDVQALRAHPPSVPGARHVHGRLEEAGVEDEDVVCPALDEL